ncbi:uncharacterized protein LOC131041003 isoform X2 [Cryptomeria japonica]|uniref:uncharacterized protein LOC131041003 isoform X2 n=1 Tax=Cryptomeria japonica TaxID=3369 RepID=UPI0027DA8676|nr:uncharacterized protein LOC131041003 isoform X2 [Cryptomeria japonica]
MEDFGGWEDVDLDESDLVKKLQASQRLPPNHYDKHTISQLSIPPHNKAAEEEEQNIRAPRRIPGPAGALHRTFHTKDGKTSVNEPRGPQLSALCPQIDLDFGQGPWLCAMDYLHRENPAENLSSNSTIDFIKKRGNIDRIPQVLGIIKTCMPNKLGSVFVTLKDPTGTIGGSIHHKVMEESQFVRDISVGAVLLLRQVFKKGSCLLERQKGASSSKNWRNLGTDIFMEAETAPLSNKRAPQCDTSISPKKHKGMDHMLRSRLLDTKATATPNDGVLQHRVTINNNLEGIKIPTQEDGSEQATHNRTASIRISNVKDNILEEAAARQNPEAGTSFKSDNLEVCCNQKASMPVTIDWNDEVEMLMSDQLDLFT